MVVRPRRRRVGAALSDHSRAVADAYGRAADSWAVGPARIYDVLADALVARSPVDLAERTLLDVGAGRGAAGRALERIGARTLAIDLAPGMVAASRRAGGPPGAAADGLALPVATGSVDGVVAAFSYNHVRDPAAALREAARVTRPGGVVLASAYADDDDHPVKTAVTEAAIAAGWSPPEWISGFIAATAPLLATVDRAAVALAAAGLDGTAVRVEVPFPELGPEDLVEWRLGMAQHAPFVATLSPPAQAALRLDALDRLGTDPPPLVRRTIALTAVV